MNGPVKVQFARSGVLKPFCEHSRTWYDPLNTAVTVTYHSSRAAPCSDPAGPAHHQAAVRRPLTVGVLGLHADASDEGTAAAYAVGLVTKARYGERGMETMPKVPVTIVTGFLGAGKTTLLQRVLSEPHGMRICVIENEFADDMGIESLILSQGLAKDVKDGIYELNNGCMCCSMRDDLLITLQRLLERRQSFDYILVEPSGMASPGPVASAFFEATEAHSAFRLDSIIAVVDCSLILSQLREARPPGTVHEAREQVACADVILLNKVDACAGGAQQVREVEEALQAINRTAVLHHTVRGRGATVGSAGGGGGGPQWAVGAEETLPLSQLLHIGAYERPLDVSIAPSSCPSCAAGAPHEHSHSHDSDIRTVVLRAHTPLRLHAFQQWVGGLLWEGRQGPAGGQEADVSSRDSGLRVLRGKGVLCIAQEDGEGEGEEEREGQGEGECATPADVMLLPFTQNGRSHTVPIYRRKYIFQSVQDTWECAPAHGAAQGLLWDQPPSHASQGPAAVESKVVLIGRGIEERKVQEGLSSCCCIPP